MGDVATTWTQYGYEVRNKGKLIGYVEKVVIGGRTAWEWRTEGSKRHTGVTATRREGIDAIVSHSNLLRVDSATDAFGMPIGPTTITTHDSELCVGRACVIHNPSDHHMRDWPMVWRGDKQMMERTCTHGIGHPDPDDLAYRTSIGDTYAEVHGCCGCCISTIFAASNEWELT